MNYLKKHKLKKFIFGITGLLIIPLYAILFSQNGPDGNLIIVTFSQIGSRYGGIEGLIIWGILTSLYYFTFFNYLFEISGLNSVILKLLLSITCLSLLITVFLPFAPTMFPVASETHNFLAYVTAVSTVVTLFVYIFSLYGHDHKLFNISLILFLIMVIIILYVLLKFGVSSLFQIVLSAGLCSFLFTELCLLEKSDHIDIYDFYKNKKTKEKDIELYE